MIFWLLGICACGDALVTEPTGPTEPNRCGPSEAFVERVIDGDTVELAGGERVRYLLIDTPESTSSTECFGPEATTFNRLLVEGQEVELEYDDECRDRFGRLLAYVRVGDREVNALMVERGFACVLHIPPNGQARVDSYEDLEAQAQYDDRGLWGACEERPCGN